MADLVGYEALMARLTAMGETNVELRTLQIGTIREAKLLVHRKTGHLGRSIVAGQVTKTSATIEARTPYAAAVEFGSKAHVIRPKKARVLAWGGTRRLSGTLSKGSRPTNFAMSVRHPGSKPYPYLIPGAHKAIGKLRDVILKLWNEAA